MTVEAHLWDCRYSGVDCERGCNCYNEDSSRCDRYESRVKVCPDCGTHYDMEVGCPTCALKAKQASQGERDRRASMKITNGRVRFHLLLDDLPISDEEQKELLSSVQGIMMMTPRLAVIEVPRHEDLTPARVLQAKQEIRDVLLGKEEPFIPALLSEKQRHSLRILIELVRGAVSVADLLKGEYPRLIESAHHAIKVVEEEIIGG